MRCQSGHAVRDATPDGHAHDRRRPVSRRPREGAVRPEADCSHSWRQFRAEGLALATALGAATPGGPFAAFPIVYALALAGADVGAVVAYLTAWSVLGLHRLIIWELPLMGLDFVTARTLASLPLPLVSGLIARLLMRFIPELPIGRTQVKGGGE